MQINAGTRDVNETSNRKMRHTYARMGLAVFVEQGNLQRNGKWEQTTYYVCTIPVVQIRAYDGCRRQRYKIRIPPLLLLFDVTTALYCTYVYLSPP